MSTVDRYWTQCMVTIICLGLLAFDVDLTRRTSLFMVGLAYAIGLGVGLTRPVEGA